MSASQARLLSITARLSDNEASAQAVSFAKQRLADETQQINEAYNKALMKTKLTAITGFNDSGAVMEDISYNLLTDTRMRTGKQYVITDTKGRVLVSSDVADAFKKSHGDVNIFLAERGLSQANNNVTQESLQEILGENSNATAAEKVAAQAKKAAIEQEIENAWDKYYASVGIQFPDELHNYSRDNLIFGFEANGANYGYPQVTIDELSSGVPRYDFTYKPLTGFWEINTNTIADINNSVSENSVHAGDVRYNAIWTNTATTVRPYDYISTPGKYYHNEVDGKYYQFAVRQDLSYTGTGEYSEEYSQDMGYIALKNGDYVYYRYANIANPNNSGSTSGTAGAVQFGEGLDPLDQAIGLVRFQDEVFNSNDDINNDYVIRSNDSRARTIKDYYTLSTDHDPALTTYAPNGTWQGDHFPKLPINFEGTSAEQRELYDYAVALTKSYFIGATYNAGTDTVPVNRGLVTTADNPENKNLISYYKNLFNKMQLNGFFTYTNSGAGDENYIRVTDLNTTVMKDSALLQEKIKIGELYLEFFSSTDKKFVSTTLGQDETLTEVEDESAIARAERQYEQDLTALQQRDKKFDLQLKKLDTEHSALQTEYDCVKQIISKNVQNSFKTFS